jgi:tRNA dimethylallyltransferase
VRRRESRSADHDLRFRVVNAAPTFPVLIGPTAGGKTRLAVDLCLALSARGTPAEVVTADSMQVYRGMNIGTAKPTLEERRGVPHHLLDLVEPTHTFTVDQWLKHAEACIASLRARGVVPVVVGGTNLYVKALLEGLFDGPAADEALRAELTSMDPHERRRELERADPAAAARIHFNDVRRTVRALEVHRLTGKPISDHQKQWGDGSGADSAVRPDALVVGLDWPTEEINKRINARVAQMIEQGLIAEARALHASGRLGPQAREALGYKQLIEAFEAGGSPAAIEDAVERIKIETRRFAKNQRTWLKRFRTVPGSIWLEESGARASGSVEMVVARLFPRSLDDIVQ